MERNRLFARDGGLHHMRLFQPYLCPVQNGIPSHNFVFNSAGTKFYTSKKYNLKSAMCCFFLIANFLVYIFDSIGFSLITDLPTLHKTTLKELWILPCSGQLCDKTITLYVPLIHTHNVPAELRKPSNEI